MGGHRKTIAALDQGPGAQMGSNRRSEKPEQAKKDRDGS
jgi:hypothetical protein